MPNDASSPLRVAVIGGGISGLAAAHRLIELDSTIQLSIFEESPHWGGILQTDHEGGFLLEHSADMFTVREPWMIELCERIGFGDQLISTQDRNRQAFIVRRGKLYPVPRGWSLLSPTSLKNVWMSPLLSIRGRWRVSREPRQTARRVSEDESLASFATRRLGREAYERIVQPLVGGIFTADPEKLSMAATMPQFLAMEQQHGSLVRGGRAAAEEQGHRKSSGARYGQFLAPRAGFSSFIKALLARLPASSLHGDTLVQHIRPGEGSRWQLDSSHKGKSTSEVFDRIVLALPAKHAAGMLQSVNDELAAELAAITASSAAIVTLGVARSQLTHPLNGFGFVVPLIEQRPIIATSFSSVKFAGRAAQDDVLLRTFVGGACQSELLEKTDAQLIDLTRQQLGELLGLQGEPRIVRCTRWNEKMPQYNMGHLDRITRIEQLVAGVPGLELAGNSYRGVGIPFCVRSGELAAERLMEFPVEGSSDRQ